LRSVGLSLLKLKLISYHLELKLRQKRKEWYELTERGGKVLKLILELKEIMENQGL